MSSPDRASCPSSRDFRRQSQLLPLHPTSPNPFQLLPVFGAANPSVPENKLRRGGRGARWPRVKRPASWPLRAALQHLRAARSESPTSQQPAPSQPPSLFLLESCSSSNQRR